MKKIKNSFGGVIGGLVLLVAGTILLWWNEGNNVKNIKTVAEVEKIVIDVESDKINNENEGKLIATNGAMKVEGNVTDETFKVSVNSAKLSRVVEIYEWDENCTTDDDGDETCSYSKGWEDHIINSSSFKESSRYQNPTSMPYYGEDYVNYNVTMGAFSLTKDQVSSMNTNATFNVTSDNTISGYHVDGNYVTNSKDLSHAEVGDIRISFKYNDWANVSVMAVQKGNSFENFVSEAGKTVNRVEEGNLSSKVMIEHMVSENNMIKWLCRAGGAFLIIMGYLALLKPICTILSFIPMLGNLVGGAISIAAFLVGLIHALLVIAIAWFRFRPILSIVLIVIIIGLIIGLKKLSNKSKTKNNS